MSGHYTKEEIDEWFGVVEEYIKKNQERVEKLEKAIKQDYNLKVMSGKIKKQESHVHPNSPQIKKRIDSIEVNLNTIMKSHKFSERHEHLIIPQLKKEIEKLKSEATDIPHEFVCKWVGEDDGDYLCTNPDDLNPSNCKYDCEAKTQTKEDKTMSMKAIKVYDSDGELVDVILGEPKEEPKYPVFIGNHPPIEPIKLNLCSKCGDIMPKSDQETIKLINIELNELYKINANNVKEIERLNSSDEKAVVIHELREKVENQNQNLIHCTKRINTLVDECGSHIVGENYLECTLEIIKAYINKIKTMTPELKDILEILTIKDLNEKEKILDDK